MASTDWMPTSSEAMYRMAMNWGGYIPSISDKANMPPEAMTALTEKTNAYGTLFQTPPAARTPAMNAELNTAKKELKETMRDVKRRYFFSPPLTDSDLISLGLKPKDVIPTPVGDPQGQATADVTYLGGQIVQLHTKHVTGTPADPKANYGQKIYYGLFADGDTLPASGEDLPKHKFTRQKKVKFEFTPADVKKTAYFCIRYENSKGKAGAWGPMISAVIP